MWLRTEKHVSVVRTPGLALPKTTVYYWIKDAVGEGAAALSIAEGYKTNRNTLGSVALSSVRTANQTAES